MSGIVKNYEIRHRLGEGGMGTVYYAVDRELHREVALKCLRPEVANNPIVMNRFRKEARAQAQLNHPNIAQIWEFFQSGSEHYLAMEFVNGPTLARVLHERVRLPFEEAGSWAIQALRGLDHAHHQGIVHRDIKPANLMIDSGGQVKVTDFGIARVRGASRETREGMIVGTYEYISPEAAQGAETTAASDLYSMGIVLYEMITGRLPFESQSEFELLRMHIQASRPSVRSMVREAPGAMDDIVRRAMDRRPEKRFRSAAGMADELQTCLDSGRKRTPSAGIKRFFSLGGETAPLSITPAPAVAERRRTDISSTCHRVEDLMEQHLFEDANSLLDSGFRSYPEEPDFVDLRNRLQRQRQQYAQAIGRQAELVSDLLNRGFPEEALKVVGNAVTMYPRASELVSLQQECRRRIDLTNLKAGELAGVQSRIDELIGAGQFQEATDHVLELLGADLNQIELNKLLVRIVQARKDAEKQAEISQVASEADQMAEAEEWESAVGILDGGLVRFPGELRLQKRRQALHERWQMEQRRREVEAIITEVHDLSISTSLRAARERLMRGFDEFGRDPALVEALERVDESIEAARRDESIAKAVAAAAELRDEGKWKAALDVLDRTATREGRDTRIEDLRASMAKQRHARDAQVARAASDARQNIQSGRWEEAVLGLSTDLRDAPGESVLNDLMQEAQRGLARKRREETIARITSEAAQRAQAGDYSDAIRLLLHAVSQYPEDETLNAALSQTLFERDQRKTGVGEMQPEDRKSSRDIPKTTEMPESDERQDVPAQVDERTAADSVEAVSDLGPRASNLQDTPEGQQTQTVHEQVERLLRQADDMASQCRLDEALRLLASAGQLDPRNAVVLDRLVEIARQRDHIQEVVHQAEEQYAAGNVAGALSVLESAPDAEAGAVISLRARIEQDRVESERRKRAQELAEAVAAVQGLITNNQLESARSELARLCARFPEEPKLEELLNYVRTSIGAADAIRAISAIRAEAAGLLRDGRSVEARAVLERGLRSYPDEAVLTSLLNRVAEQRPKRWPTPAPETREEPAGRAPFPDRPPETEEADPTLSATKVILKPLPRKYYIGAAATLLTVALLAGVLVLTRSKPAVILSPDPTELSFDVAAGSVRPPRQRVRWSDESIPFLVYNKDSWIEWFHPEDAGVVTEIGIIPAGMPAGRYEGFVTIRPMSSDDRKVEGTTTIAVHLTIHEPVPQPGSNPGTAISESPPKPSPNPPLKAVKAQLEPVIESFTAEPRRIEPGQQVNLRWSVGNADTVTIDPGIGRVEPSGLRILYPTEWTYYRLIARGPGGSKEAAVEITVNSPGEVETPDLGHVTVYTYKSRNFEVGEGNGDKMNYRGIMLYFGQGADRRDYVAAMKWFRQAVAVGSSDGMFNIGWLYEHGEGVRKDKHYASLMYQRAAAAGNKDALSYLHHHPEILRVKQ